MNKEVKQWLKAIGIVIGFGVVFVVGAVSAFLLASYAPYVLSTLALICILVVLVSVVKDYLDDKDERDRDKQSIVPNISPSVTPKNAKEMMITKKDDFFNIEFDEDDKAQIG